MAKAKRPMAESRETHGESKTPHGGSPAAGGDDMEAMISDDTSVPRSETTFALSIDEGTPLTVGEEYTFEFEMLDDDDEPVTVTHTARWSAA